ncbi:hypothetical protein [Xenorhabdus innexi]|uniref:Uncharacterized protein n=1 Tax=Xenorhabdus innexi TaxID=290109 RepID=A0A1N6MVU3_9GAMM|nr:hypothetical protein [Xenorhabdus innexi]PHM38317.1 hypothetical protein Xinn_00431 [Xenorhabdus innexi]SIP72859.1 hypothetical protein XIS1_1680096 [Xenorhabdus innexi]
MNINTVLSDKKESVSPITVSIPDGADVIVGQHCYLVVTVKSPQIKSIKSISIEVPNKDIVVKQEKDWKLIDDASGEAIFMLEVDGKLLPNTSISYTVHAYSDTNVDVEGITPLTVGYTTKRMKKDSVILLSTDIEILATTDIPNPIDNPNTKYNVYSGVITDENGSPLKNTQVIISSLSTPHSIQLANITTNPINGNAPEIIKPQERTNQPDFITINSDDNGNIEFRVYAKQSMSVTIKFTTEIFGVIYPTYVASAYLVAGYGSDGLLQIPSILDISSGGVVKKRIGIEKFRVGVPSYSSPVAGDTIIFLIKDENNKVIQLKPTSYVESRGTNLGGHSFTLSYEKIPFNKRLEFYYLVVLIGGYGVFSKKLNVIFEDDSGNKGGTGGTGGHKNDCDNGLYNKVDVDSSYEDGKFSLKIKSITLI